jgi:hypothetical protein
MTLSDLEGVAQQLRDVSASFDAGCVSGDDAARVVRVCGELSRLVYGIEVRAVARVEATGVWGRDGARSCADWLASVNGSSSGSARRELAVGQTAVAVAQVGDALQSGLLSADLAAAVVVGVDADASATDGLLAMTQTPVTVRQVQEASRRVREGSSRSAEIARHEAAYRKRCLRRWFDDREGLHCTLIKTTADQQAVLDAQLKAFVDEAIAGVRRSGARVSSDALAHDGFFAMVSSGAASPVGRRPVSVEVSVDWTALRRGYAVSGETCEIARLGPIPVALAQLLAQDCYLKVLLQDGSRIIDVAHDSRYIAPRQKSAVMARDKRCCAVPGCDASLGLEIDHIVGRAQGGPSHIDNLVLLCRYHHRLKTLHGFRLVGSPGQITGWVGPDSDEVVRFATTQARKRAGPDGLFDTG